MMPVYSKLRGLDFIVIITLIAIISGTLLISDFFVYRSLTPFYLFLIGVSAFLVVTGCSLAIRTKVSVPVSLPIIIALLLACYVTLHGLLVVGNFNPFHLNLVFDCCLIVSVFIAVRIRVLNMHILFQAIVLLAVVEAVICVGQYCKLLPAFNNDFAVTGTWENPNVTAMFLAMSVPALAVIKTIGRYVIFSVGALIIAAILLLQCRTALIGITVTGLFFFKYKYGHTRFFSEKRNRPIRIVVAISLLAISIPIAGYFYNAKRASADGRTLIWKLSSEMILQKPLLGYGYGSFEKYYNLFQSEYFKNGNGSAEEIAQAGFVRMSYNEFLQNTVEGGLPGLLLITGLFITLLSVPIFKKTEKATDINNGQDIDLAEDQYWIWYSIAFAGIASFAAMSLVNFSFQALPAMCLFAIYAGLLATHPYFKKINLVTNSEKHVVGYRLTLGSSLILFGLYSLYFNITTANDSLLNKHAETLNSHSDNKAALQTLIPLATGLYNYESYWVNYGDLLLSIKDYRNALDKFNKAKSLTANPKLYLKTAFCYQKLGNYKSAEKDYMVAEYTEPSRLTPKYDLMAMYMQLRDTSNAAYMAKQIMVITPKIKTSEASFYKYQAYALLKQLGITNTGQVNYFIKPVNKTNTTFN